MNSIEIFSSNVKNPLITIAIPTFRRSFLLKEAILSALNQGANIPYDIIVVDNNPERYDETEQLMDQFKDNPLIGYYKNTSNFGMVGNWNQLFCLAKGEWVSMLHDDDLLYPTYIDVICDKMSCMDNPSIIFPSYHTGNDRENLNFGSKQSSCFIRKISLKSFIIGNIIGPPIGMLVKKDFYSKNLKFRIDFYPSIDWDFYMESSRLGNLYKISDKLCLYYIGVNESLKEDTIIGFFRNAREFNQKLSCLLKFPYNFINKLCYRNLIVNTINWTSKISNEMTVLKAVESIGYKRNRILETFSNIIVKIFTLINNNRFFS